MKKLLLFCLIVSCVAASRRGIFMSQGPAVAAGGGGSPALELQNSVTGNPATLAITNGGVNRLQFVVVGIGDANQDVVAAVSNQVGTAFTKAWGTNASTWVRCEGWYLLNPPTGSNWIMVTTAAAWDQIGVIVMNFTNVNQSTPVGTPVGNAGSSTAPAVTITSAIGELVVGGACTDAQGTLAVNGGTLIKLLSNISSDIDAAAAYYTGAASVSAAWTSGNDKWAVGGVSLKGP